jgi:hypothetical protein
MAFLLGCGICVGLFVAKRVIYPHVPPLPIDFGRPQDYNQIVHWNIGANGDLLDALANARHINIDWGDLHTELPEDDVKNLRTFVRSYFQILAEERALCTNPNCKQPIDDGKQ